MGERSNKKEQPKHKTALAIQYLLNHSEISSEEISKLASKKLLDQIQNSSNKRRNQHEEEETHVTFLQILKKPSKQYRDAASPDKKERSRSRSRSPSKSPKKKKSPKGKIRNNSE